MVPHVTLDDFLDDSTDITVEVVCVDCKRTKTFTVSKAGYDCWVKGDLIQRAMPEVPDADREILISQTCGDCFDKLFEGIDE